MESLWILKNMSEDKAAQGVGGEDGWEGLMGGLSMREVFWLSKLLNMGERERGVWLGRVAVVGGHLVSAVAQIQNGFFGDLAEVRGKLARIGEGVQRRAAVVHGEQVEGVILRWLGERDGEESLVRRWLGEGGEEGEERTEREGKLLRWCVKCFPLGPVHLGKQLRGGMGGLCAMDGGVLEVLLERLGLFILAFSLKRADHRQMGAMVAALEENDHEYLIQLSNIFEEFDESLMRELRMLARLILMNAGVYRRDYLGAFLRRIGVCLLAVGHFGQYDFEAQFLAVRVPEVDGLAVLQCLGLGARISEEVLQWLREVLVKMAANPLLLRQLSHLQGVFAGQRRGP